MITARPLAGDEVTLRATIVRQEVANRFIVNLDSGITIEVPISAICSIDRKEVVAKSIVESILPSRQDMIGVVLFIDGTDAFVRWNDGGESGRATTEKVSSLRVTHISPS